MQTDIFLSDEFKRQFKRLAKKYHSLKQDYLQLEKDLHENPEAGTDLGNGMHKVRMGIASKGRGKSGGARIITFKLEKLGDHYRIVLLTIYDKSEMDNVSDAYLKSLATSFISN